MLSNGLDDLEPETHAEYKLRIAVIRRNAEHFISEFPKTVLIFYIQNQFPDIKSNTGLVSYALLVIIIHHIICAPIQVFPCAEQEVEDGSSVDPYNPQKAETNQYRHIDLIEFVLSHINAPPVFNDHLAT